MITPHASARPTRDVWRTPSGGSRLRCFRKQRLFSKRPVEQGLQGAQDAQVCANCPLFRDLVAHRTLWYIYPQSIWSISQRFRRSRFPTIFGSKGVTAGFCLVATIVISSMFRLFGSH